MKIEQKDLQKKILECEKEMKDSSVFAVVVAILGFAILVASIPMDVSSQVFFVPMGIFLFALSIACGISKDNSRILKQQYQIAIRTFFDKDYVPEDYLIEKKEVGKK